MVDNDRKLRKYFDKHRANMQADIFCNAHEIKESPDLKAFFEMLANCQN